MPIPAPSVDELVSSITKSNLISVVIEGKDDAVAYRLLETLINRELNTVMSLVPAGGRNNVIEVMRKLRGSASFDRCVFICDRDLWLFDGVPSDVLAAQIILTDGYSIENDLIRDYDPKIFMDTVEASRFDDEVSYFCKRFAIEVANHLAGNRSNVAISPDVVFSNPLEDLEIHISHGGIAEVIHSAIASDHQKFLRGKSLLRLVLRQLAAAGMRGNHSHQNFISHSAAARGHYFLRIVEDTKTQVRAKL